MEAEEAAREAERAYQDQLAAQEEEAQRILLEAE